MKEILYVFSSNVFPDKIKAVLMNTIYRIDQWEWERGWRRRGFGAFYHMARFRGTMSENGVAVWALHWTTELLTCFIMIL